MIYCGNRFRSCSFKALRLYFILLRRKHSRTCSITAAGNFINRNFHSLRIKAVTNFIVGTFWFFRYFNTFCVISGFCSLQFIHCLFQLFDLIVHFFLRCKYFFSCLFGRFDCLFNRFNCLWRVDIRFLRFFFRLFYQSCQDLFI